MNGDSGFGFISARELVDRVGVAAIIGPQAIPERFGNWRYDAKLEILFHVRYPGYEIDLERLTTSAKCLDTIMQVTAKTPFSRQDAGDFIEAIRAKVNPQANLCSWGRECGKEPGR